MANPAQLMYAAFKEWDTRGKPNTNAINARATKRTGGLSRHVQAVGWLTEIAELLDVMEQQGRNVSQYRLRWKHWRQMVFAYPTGWERAYPSFDEGDMDVLASLADTLSQIVDDPTPDELATVGQHIDGLIEAIRDDAELPVDLKAHLLALASHSRNCIDEHEILGTCTVNAAVDRLMSNLTRAVKGVPETTQSPWREWFKKLWWVWFGAAVGGIAQVVAGEAADQLLGSSFIEVADYVEPDASERAAG